jgi:regulator of sigma E protease
MAQMQGWLIALVSVTFVLGIMIFVHEWGHFIAAKLAGVRVEIFSLGFGARLFGVKRGDTDYRLSALPFGGYVRMAGDNPVEERTGAPDEFLSKPRWVRVLIAVAGPAMNIFLGFAIFWGIFFLKGVPVSKFLHQAPVVASVPQYKPVVSGIQAGDRILSVNGAKISTWEDVYSKLRDLKAGEPVTLVVSRGGADIILAARAPEKLDAELSDIVGYAVIPAVIEEVGIGTPAEKAGLRPGDKFVSIDSTPVRTWPQLVDAVRNSDGRALQFIVNREGKQETVSITPIKGMDPSTGLQVWQIGISPQLDDEFHPQSLGVSATVAVGATLSGMKRIMDVLAGLFTGKVSVRQLQGVIGIARESGRAAKQGPMPLSMLMAVISLNLGLLNLLPIPILDGGHVLLLAIEGLLRRDLSIAVKERFVQVGLVFLLGIFAFVMYSDILRLVQSH